MTARLKKKKRMARIAGAVLLVLALTVTAVIGLVFQESPKMVYAAAAEDPVSDAGTSGNYTASLGNDTSTRYAGRVWTDKTVSSEDMQFSGDVGNVTVEKGNSDFLVAYSALAQSQSVSGQAQVPVDVVFVIDNSNSMDDSVGGNSGESRLDATVDAVNTSIAKIMESNEDSRVGVVIYGGEAETLMPLGHYSPMRGSEKYIEYSSWRGSTTFTSASGNRLTMSSGDRGTNTHMGVDAGMDILLQAEDIGSGTMKHVPALILLSDGASTYAGGGSWWEPSGSIGIGSEESGTFALQTAMNAQYKKQLVNDHYGAEEGENTSCKIYTIGMGLEQLNGSQKNVAQIALDPGSHLEDDNETARTVKNTWESYRTGGTPTMEYPSGTGWFGSIQYSDYTFRHPYTGDIRTIAYNDGYYAAENAEDVVNVFDDITSTIITSRPSVPTEVTGEDPVHDGYITYTDPIGQYMEVDSVKAMIYGGVKFENPEVETSGNTTTYTFHGTITSEVYGNQDASAIQIAVSENDGSQTMTVKIPAAAIPLRVNTIELDSDGAVLSNTSNRAYPVRILYGVSMAGKGENGYSLEEVGEEYIEQNRTEDGKVQFYSNLYTGENKTDAGKTAGNATVEFKPASGNPFYFVQEDTPLYLSESTEAPASGYRLEENRTYYFQFTYYDGNEEKTAWVGRPGSLLADYAERQEGWSGQWYLKAGAPRLGNLNDFTAEKSQNVTKTADTSYYPTFAGTAEDGSFKIYLGNNGMLAVEAPKSLTIEKKVTAADGLTAPEKEFTFRVTVEGKENQEASGILHDGETQTEKRLKFDENGTAEFVLKAEQSMEILNLGAGVRYTVEETSLPAGFTSDQKENRAEGTISAEGENVVAFTNHYSVTPVTSEELGMDLKGIKTIDGRPFQEGDQFTFTIAAAGYTPDAPLPEKDGRETSQTMIEPEAGTEADFIFDGTMTFDKPGEYRYIIREAAGNLPGVDYDSALYRLSVVIVDNGDGTLRAATPEEIQERYPETQVPYTTNPYLEKTEGGGSFAPSDEIRFQNRYDAVDAVLSLTGTKVLEVKNSDKTLTDGQFEFQVEALGSNTDGGDVFAPDASQPVPENPKTANIANGDVMFGTMTFDQSMIGKTFGYKITEVLPEGVSAETPVKNGTTYDTTEKIVKVTVDRSDEGGTEHIVASVTPEEAGQNFVFHNQYEPETAEIGGEAGNAVTVQKMFGGREWKDGDVFQYTIRNTERPEGTEAPMPEASSITIGKPNSGAQNQAAFGKMTFDTAGTYVYEIRETKGTLGGVSYDGHAATVTVQVTEDAESGKLNASVSYDNTSALTEADRNNQTAAAFTNTYQAVFDPATAVTLGGRKELSGKSLEAGEFFFTVEAVEGAPLGDSGEMNPNAAGTDEEGNGTSVGTIELLKNIVYEKEGTYRYLIREQIPELKKKGVSYDETVYQATVQVTDDGNGSLRASEPEIWKGKMADGQFTGTEQVSEIVFRNAYAPLPAVVTPLSITKELKGDRAAGLKAGEFRFEMTLKIADPSDGIQLPAETSAANASDGTVQFGEITFTKPGTYVVQVKETVPEEKVPGVTYDGHVLETTFTVTDVDGQLTASRTGNTSRTFTNLYSSKGVSAELTGTKNITGRDFQKGDEFTFAVSGTYEGEAEGVTVPLPQHVKAETEGEASGTVTATPEEGSSTVINFGTITFTRPGTYTYTISEQENVPAGVSVDKTSYTVTYRVTDNGDGTMTVDGPEYRTGESAAEGLVWTNHYAPEEGSVNGETDLTGTKTLYGRDALSGESFAFLLAPADEGTKEAADAGQIVMGDSNASVSGLKDGEQQAFHFGNITFKTEGVYTFQMTEILPDGVESEDPVKNGVVYDTHAGTVIITVTDNTQTGKLEASVKAENTDFENSYQPTPVTYGADTLLGGHKYMQDETGHYSFEDGQFTFYMRAQKPENPLPKGLGITEIHQGELHAAAVKNSNTRGSQAEYDFGELTFTKPGTYQYNIFEDTGKLPAGVSGDGTAYTVTFQVEEDQETGRLSIGEISAVKITAGGEENEPADIDRLDFTNTYSADSIQGSQYMLKTLSGRNFQEGDRFVFDISVKAEDEDGLPMDYGDIPQPDGKEAGGVLSAVTPNETGDGYAYSIEIAPSATQTGNTYRFNTGTFTYTHTGTYRYTVREQAGGDSKLDYDDRSYTVEVKISVEESTGEPVLKREVTIDGKPVTETGTLDFTNVYTPDSVTLTGETALKVQKRLEGRGWKAEDSFEYTLTPVTPDAPMPENPKAVTAGGEAAEGEAVAVGFGDMVYSKADLNGASSRTFRYRIAETKGTAGGIDYDTHTADVWVTVTDNTAAGCLEAEVRYQNAGAPDEEDAANTAAAAFTNRYHAEETELEGSAALKVTKVIENRPWQEGDAFLFVLTGGDEKTRTAIEEGTVKLPENAAGLTIAYDPDAPEAVKEASFGNVVFAEPGDYVLHITEVRPEEGAIGGITYDTEPHAVRIHVEDELDGTMTAQVTEGANPVITNVYAPGGSTELATADFSLTKIFTGKAWEEETFQFELTAAGGTDAEGEPIAAEAVPMPENPVAVAAGPEEEHGNSASFDFGTIVYEAAGTYRYEVREAAGGNDNPGIIYDTARVARITVKVSDDLHGGYTAAVTAASDTQFTNTYQAEAAEVTLTGEKVLNGRPLKETDRFQFTIEAVGENAAEAPMPAGKTAESDAQGNFSFGTVRFEKEGTYTYQIREEEGMIPGIVYDQGVVTVTVQVTDNQKGALEAAVSYQREGVLQETLQFVNTYAAAPTEDVTAGFRGKKTVTPSEGNSYAMRGGEFAFTLTPAQTNPESDPVPKTTAENDADGNVILAGSAVYTEAGTYLYTVTEENTAVGGIRYDGSVYTIRVEVTDDQETGRLNASVSVEKDGALADGILFENYYDPGQTSVVLGGQKYLDGKALTSGEFWFELEGVQTETAEETAPAGPEETQTGTSETETAVPSESVAPESSAEESQPSAAEETGSADAAAESAKIAETLASVSEMTAEEATEAVMSSVEEVVKEIGSVVAATVPAVQAKAENTEIPMPAQNRVSNTESGVFQFGEIVYTEPGTYIYHIREIAEGKEGYTYDSTVYTVKVTVNDQNGKLTAQTETEGGNPVAFYNRYQPVPATLAGETAIGGQKTLEGRGLKEGEFVFQLKDAKGQTLEETSNRADGSFRFGEMTFTEEGDYSYSIVEKDTGLGGVHYDASVYAVTVHVKDVGGHLEAEAEYRNADGDQAGRPEFWNVYEASPASVSLGAVKVFKGGTLEAGAFSFVLRDAKGQVVKEAANDAEGKIDFGTLTFAEAGLYRYTAAETAGSAEGVIYDSHIYEIEIAVTDNGMGSLEAEVRYAEGEPVFTNIYEETEELETPVQPEPTEPETTEESTESVHTGDTTPIVPTVAAMILAAGIAAASGATLLWRKKRGRR